MIQTGYASNQINDHVGVSFEMSQNLKIHQNFNILKELQLIRGKVELISIKIHTV